MWISLIGFMTVTMMLLWLVSGYFVWLKFVGDDRRTPDISAITEFPTLSIIVPCYNESDIIAHKLRNLLSCDYPADRMEIVLADGGSTDRTVEILRTLSADHPHVRVEVCPQGGKINQLNHILPTLAGEYIVITDADARLATDTLTWVAAEFQADPRVALVGACTTPSGGLPIDQCYWAAQNRVRLLESKVAHVPIVAACCYAFRRGLIERFPGDVIADDVYAAVLANMAGHRTTYSSRATVEELRTPTGLREFFIHKYRKANAVLREMLRVCHRLPDMSARWKPIFSTVLAQQLLLPWLAGAWIVFGATLVNFGQFDVVGLSILTLFVGLLMARRAALSVDLPAGNERFSLVTFATAFVFPLAIVFAAALTYTFFRQDSHYKRINGESPARRTEPAAVRVPTPTTVVAGMTH